jgi:hypothetical protein
MPPKRTFPLSFDGQIIGVTKITEQEFTPAHNDLISSLVYTPQRLTFPDPRWRSLYLGAGEEKAVYCVCDENLRVFALELIDERHYLNGRFVGGQYFANRRVATLANVRANPDSEFGLAFTGLVKVREFVYGYEWSRFQYDPRRFTALDGILTAYLKSFLAAQFNTYRARYEDVHDRNILFEIRPRHQSGVPVLIRDHAGHLKLVKVGLQPIDVR